MNFRRYQNELIVGVAFFIMLIAFLFKHGQISAQESHSKEVQSTLNEIKEVVALKEIWDGKDLTRKIKELKTVVSEQKVKWNQKTNKVTASYTGLTVNELNNLVKKLLNLGVEINLFEVKKDNGVYNVELACKW